MLSCSSCSSGASRRAKNIDKSPLVRAASAVALTRCDAEGAHAAAIAAIEPRLKHGETNDDVRGDLEKARSLLAKERTDVEWTEVGTRSMFKEMALTYVQRLLREVNLRLMASLDLAKIQNLQTDSEVVPIGPPSQGTDPGDVGGGSEPGEGDNPPPGGSGDNPPAAGDSPAPGVARTSQYQELRDLKVELRRRPYFAIDDLPPPTTTPGRGK